MTAAMRRHEFTALGSELVGSAGPDAAAYWSHHFPRLWDSYERAAELVPVGGSVIAVGAGPAYVEAALVRSHHARAVVVDLPGAVKMREAHYARVGLEAHGIDLTTQPHLTTVVGGDFDLALSLEIVEHLPVPPTQHIAPMVEALRPRGSLLLSTPNAGNLRSILKTIMHRPTLPPAGLTFSPVSFENEGVHRREYMKREIVDAFDECGLTVTDLGWVSYNRHSRADALLLPVERLVPPLRRTMSITGRA